VYCQSFFGCCCIFTIKYNLASGLVGRGWLFWFGILLFRDQID
jgi:hypothetical protein